jgi:hypothetical protein
VLLQRKGPLPLTDDAPEPAVSSESLASLDGDVTVRWREELMAKVWEALAALQEMSRQPFHAALRLRAEKPDLRSEPLAAEPSARLGRPISAGARGEEQLEAIPPAPPLPRNLFRPRTHKIALADCCPVWCDMLKPEESGAIRTRLGTDLRSCCAPGPSGMTCRYRQSSQAAGAGLAAGEA